MAELSGFARIAPYLTNPLVLAGFARPAPRPPEVESDADREPKCRRQGAALVLRCGFILALVVIVLGFGLVFWQTERTTVDVDEILDNFRMATAEAAASQGKLDTIARLNELEDGAFRDAVLAIVREGKSPNAPEGIDRAIELLRQGETGAAETVLTEILDRRLQERATASQAAAEAARHLGAIAYVNDTAKAIEAYRKATELDPGDTWSWIYLGRLYQRTGDLAAAEQAFDQAQPAAERAGEERDVLAADIDLGEVRVAAGDLAGAVAAYELALATAQRLAAQDPGNAGWQRDLIVTHVKLAEIAEDDQRMAARARQHYEAALAIARDLEISKRLAPTDDGWSPNSKPVSHASSRRPQTAEANFRRQPSGLRPFSRPRFPTIACGMPHHRGSWLACGQRQDCFQVRPSGPNPVEALGSSDASGKSQCDRCPDFRSPCPDLQNEARHLHRPGFTRPLHLAISRLHRQKIA
jgi:tetratricopeptide (TPR) repeat protein